MSHPSRSVESSGQKAGLKPQITSAAAIFRIVLENPMGRVPNNGHVSHLLYYPLAAGRKAVRAARLARKRVDHRRGTNWCRKVSVAADTLAPLSPVLWTEAEEFVGGLELRASHRLCGLGHLKLGGPADCRLLYFITRWARPATVVETGVAAGWSTAALLEGLAANGGEGRLWSSELPYDRPEIASDYRPYVGLLVDRALEERWSLMLEGDQINIPVILDEVSGVDLFHYDSRKAYQAREETLELVLPSMRRGSAIIVDDVGDNTHFRDWVSQHTFDYQVFVCGDKYVGVVWL